MNNVKTYTNTNDIEHEYLKFTTIEHRKKFAQFFTPFQIADLMAKWLIGNKELKSKTPNLINAPIASITIKITTP